MNKGQRIITCIMLAVFLLSLIPLLWAENSVSQGMLVAIAAEIVVYAGLFLCSKHQPRNHDKLFYIPRGALWD